MTQRDYLRVLSGVLVFGAFTIGYLQANSKVYGFGEVGLANLGYLSGLIALATNFLPSVFGNAWPRPEDQNKVVVESKTITTTTPPTP